MNFDYYKLSVSKILSYLNKKFCSVNVDSLDENKNSASILTNFLPEEISENFLRFKSRLL